ncbi:glutamate receptor 2.9-like [Salvia hispanica]|uniref:glutamate receptor 2.9-like n=1 Tax=Salvia hispanica TaxID=49212 RepID=UPI002009D6E2|nr:glutamate receptor 2.9-like [Salvia hispanica]
MAIEDFYSNRSYNTMIEPHFRDSKTDVVAATSAAIDLLKNTQVMAIFGPQTSIQADFVIDISNKVKVPIISPATSPSLSPQESPYFIRSSWSASSQAKAVAAIVKNFGWREVVLVHEDTVHKIGLLPFFTQYLSEGGSFVSNMTAISPSADKDDILEKLKELREMQTRVFVVHMSQSLASRFFKLAWGAGMMEEGYVWIVSGLITGLLDWESIEAMQGVVGVRAYFPRSSEVRGFETRWRKRFYEENPEFEIPELSVFGLWAYDSMVALAEAVEGVDVTYPLFERGVLLGNGTDLEEIGISNNGPKLAPLMRNYMSKGLSGDFMTENGELQPSVFEIVNVLGNGPYTVGFWREGRGISKRLGGDDGGGDPGRRLGAVVWPGQTSEVPRGWDVNGLGKKLKVGVPLKGRTRGLISAEVDEKTKKVKPSGFCIDVFEEVMRSMPYVEYEYVAFDDRNSTGFDYDGLIEQVFLKVNLGVYRPNELFHIRCYLFGMKFDVVVAGITMSANRSKYVDFTIPYIESGASAVVPIVDDKNAWIFMKPLTTGLWLTIGAYFIFTGFVVWALEHRLNDEFRGPPLQQVGMIFWFSFSTLVFAHKEKVKSNLSRFVVIVWLFAVLVLTSSYTASLTSMLTVQQLDPADIHDLTRKGEYIGYKEGPFIRSVLEGIKSDKSKFKNYTSFEDYNEGLTLGWKGGVGAIVDNLPSNRLFLKKYCHNYTMIGPTYRKSGIGFAFQKGSPLAPDVSRAILEMKENGKMDEISDKWFGQVNCGCRNGTTVAGKRLDLVHFKGLFLISGLSSLSALIISLLIFIYKNRSVLTARGPIKRKLSDLAGAFDREREDKSSKESRTSFEERVVEEGRISQDVELSTIELVVVNNTIYLDHQSTGFNSSAAKADVGVILDLDTPLGKVCRTCISMAVEDFYANRNHTTMIVPHFRDSKGDVIPTAYEAIDLLKNTQVMAIFGPQNSNQADFVINMGDRANIPIISPAMSPSLSPQDSPFFIRTAWPSFSHSKAIAAIVKKYNWLKVVFVYEDSGFGRGLVPFLDKHMLESNAYVSYQTAICPTSTDDLIARELDKLKKMQTRVFVVDMLPVLASRFFKLAKSDGMMEEGYAWILSDPLASLLDLMDSKTIEAMQGVLGVRARVPESEEVTNFTKRYNKRFRDDNPKMEVVVKPNIFGLWAYDSATAIADSIERVGLTSPRFNRGNSTDLETIGTSSTGPLLIGLMKNHSSKGLSSDFNVSNGQLQPSAFEIVNVHGEGEIIVGFWSEKCGIWKPGDKEDGCSRNTENLDLVVWPGKTSDAPKGWEFPTNGTKLRVGIPAKGGFVEFIGVAKDVFQEVWNKTPYATSIKYVDECNGGDYDDCVKKLDAKKIDVVVGDVTITKERFHSPPLFLHTCQLVPLIMTGERVSSNLTKFVLIVWMLVVLVLSSSYTANLTSMLTMEQLNPDIKAKDCVGYQNGSFVGDFLMKEMKFDKSKLMIYSSWEQFDEALSKGCCNGGVDAIYDEMPYINLFLSRSKNSHKYKMFGPIHPSSGFGFAFTKGSPLVSDVSRGIIKLIADKEYLRISEKWVGQAGNGTRTSHNSLDVASFGGLFLIAGLSSILALLIFSFNFLRENRVLLASTDSTMEKLRGLARAFVMGKDKPLSPNTSTSRQVWRWWRRRIKCSYGHSM